MTSQRTQGHGWRVSLVALCLVALSAGSWTYAATPKAKAPKAKAPKATTAKTKAPKTKAKTPKVKTPKADASEAPDAKAAPAVRRKSAKPTKPAVPAKPAVPVKVRESAKGKVAIPVRNVAAPAPKPPPKPQARRPFAQAILLSGGGSPRSNFYSHVLYLRLMRQVLQELGQPDDKIDIFTADGDDPGADLAIVRSGRSSDYWIFSYLREARFFPRLHEQINTEIQQKKLHKATRKVFKTQLAALAKRLAKAKDNDPNNADAPLMLFVTDHGTRNRRDRSGRNQRISMWKENMSVTQFHKAVRPLKQRKMVFVMSQCFSGSFLWSVFRKPGRFGVPLGNRCGFLATLPNRYSYGCFPETRLKKQVGHAYRFILAMRNAKTFNDAHKEVLLSDLTPDVPHRTSDGYLYALLQSDAKADGVKPHKLVDQILARFEGKTYPGMTQDLALLGAVAQRFGLPRPMNMKALMTIRKNTDKKRRWLARAARMWREVFITARSHHLGVFYKGTPALREQVMYWRRKSRQFFRKLHRKQRKKQGKGPLFGRISTPVLEKLVALDQYVYADEASGCHRDERGLEHAHPHPTVVPPPPVVPAKLRPKSKRDADRQRRIDSYLDRLRKIYNRRHLKRNWRRGKGQPEINSRGSRGRLLDARRRAEMYRRALERIRQLREIQRLKRRAKRARDRRNKARKLLRRRRRVRRLRRLRRRRRTRRRRRRARRRRRLRTRRSHARRRRPKRPKVLWPAMRTIKELRQGFVTYIRARPRLQARLKRLHQKEKQMRQHVFWVKTRLAALKRMEMLFYRIAGRLLLEHDKHPDFRAYRRGVNNLIACESTPLNHDTAPHEAKKFASLTFSDKNLPLPSWFGISFRPLRPKNKPVLPPGAVEVDAVYLNTPARKAGLRPGDIILSVNDEQLREPFEIRERVMLAPSTKPTPMLVLRGGALLELQVQLHRLTRPPSLKLAPIVGRQVSNIRSARLLRNDKPPKSLGKGLNMLFFWATWCGPCKVMLPDMRRWQARYKQLRIITVSNEKPGVIRRWIKGHPKALPFENIYDPGRVLFRRFRIQGTPTMYVIKDGKIMYRHVGFRGLKKLEAQIRKHHP